ncbi:MAG: GIY-YIG nuclease family protein [Alphaproteobacteria bacterium]
MVYKKKQSVKTVRKKSKYVGISGYIYIIKKSSYTQSYFKIGSSRYTGQERAAQINDFSSSVIKKFFCIYELRTTDYIKAWKRIAQKLEAFRIGKRSQEYFHIDLDKAKAIIIEECHQVDKEYASKQKADKTPIESIKNLGTRLMAGRYEILKTLGK